MIIVRDPPGTLPKFLEGGEYDGEGPVPEVELVVLGLTVHANKGRPPAARKKTCAVDGGPEYKDCWEYEIHPV